MNEGVLRALARKKNCLIDTQRDRTYIHTRDKNRSSSRSLLSHPTLYIHSLESSMAHRHASIQNNTHCTAGSRSSRRGLSRNLTGFAARVHAGGVYRRTRAVTYRSRSWLHRKLVNQEYARVCVCRGRVT